MTKIIMIIIIISILMQFLCFVASYVFCMSSDRALTKVSLGTKIDRLHCQRKCFHISLNNLQIVVSQ